MELAKNIQKIALIFFLILGTLHIISYLMIINEYNPQIAYMVKSISEIPFIITALVYGFVSLKISLTVSENEHRIINFIFVGIVSIVFVILLILNIFVPDRF